VVSERGPAWVREVSRLDEATYAAIAGTSTPGLDRAMARLSHAADYSRFWISASAAMALFGGNRGRRAAVSGLRAVVVTSVVVNVVVKPLARRRRPDRLDHQVPSARHVPMPASRSFPSGHAAVAFAFAGAAGRVMPVVSLPLHALAGLVAYSRVHTGVHYPLDVVVGSLLGASLSSVSSMNIDHLRPDQD
jgi:membrane-associated phospholipid phosphatase